MRIVIISNMLNHHQLPLCNAFLNMDDVEFHFIATEPIHSEQLNLGYSDMNHSYPFVICSYDSPENVLLAEQMCFDADVVVIGSANPYFVKRRIKFGKIVFCYSERLFKSNNPLINLGRGIKWFFKSRQLGGNKKNCFLLCAGSFVSNDYKKLGVFRDRMYKWGYFPQRSDVQRDLPSNEIVKIIWVGRLISWKHPEKVISLAEYLVQKGYSFSIDIIGIGPLFDELKKMIFQKHLENYVSLLGSCSPDDVKAHMRHADIFVSTSDRGEGWGAVINEAMDSGCAVVASDEIGSVAYLIQNNSNGIVYNSRLNDDLFAATESLIVDKDLCRMLGDNAHNTIENEWNADVAANRLLLLYGNLTSEGIIDNGICSRI